MNEISPCEIEDIDVTIHLANKKIISPLRNFQDVEVLCGKVKYPTDFLILAFGQNKINFAPLYLLDLFSKLVEPL